MALAIEELSHSLAALQLSSAVAHALDQPLSGEWAKLPALVAAAVEAADKVAALIDETAADVAKGARPPVLQRVEPAIRNVTTHVLQLHNLLDDRQRLGPSDALRPITEAAHKYAVSCQRLVAAYDHFNAMCAVRASQEEVIDSTALQDYVAPIREQGQREMDQGLGNTYSLEEFRQRFRLS